MEYQNPTTQSDNSMNNVRDNVRDLQSRASDTLDQVGRRWNDTMQTVQTRARDMARQAESAMQQNPWAALGIGFGAGVVMGALLMLAAGPKR